MPRRFHALAISIVALLTVMGWVSAGWRPSVTPVQAQVVTPDPSPPSFKNQRFVVGSDNLVNIDQTTFATAHVPDPTAFPTTTVHVHNYEGGANDQHFWLSVRIRQQDAGVEVVPEPGFAQMGLIAPGGDATYTVTFPNTTSARVEFEVDGSTDDAVMLTILQFALEAGFDAASIGGFGGHDAEIGQILAEVVVEQYLADLPTLSPCANAVAAVQRGINDQAQFSQDVQGCLASPMWQVSVDQVQMRMAKRDWFQQSLNAAGLLLPELGIALKGVTAMQFAAKVWGMYEKFHPKVAGAMVGTVAFMSVDTMPKGVLGTATAVPEISIYEVVGRAQAALLQAGTYRYELTFVGESGERRLAQRGEVVIQGGQRMEDVATGMLTFVDTGGMYHQQNADGTWFSYFPPGSPGFDSLTEFVSTPVTDWSLLRIEQTAGRNAHVIERTTVVGAADYRETYWIDAETFLPLKRVGQEAREGATAHADVVYFDFGAPVDVAVPQEALAPTPTPQPTPPPINPETLDPEALFNLLLTSQFPDEAMPLGYGVGGIFAMPGEDIPDGALRGVRVETDKSFGMATDDIEFYIYATPAEAARGSEEIAAQLQRSGVFSYGPVADLGFPATQLGGSFSAAPFIGTGTLSIVVVQVGNVIVASESYALPDAQAQADSNAADLAAAGVQHLGTLVGSPAAEEAEAAIQATAEAAAREEQARSAEPLLTTSAGTYSHMPGEGVSVPVDVENADTSGHTIQIAVELNVYADEGPVSWSSWNLLGTAEVVVPAGTTVTTPVLLDKTGTSVPTDEILQFFRDYPPDLVRDVASYVVAIDGFTVHALPQFRTSETARDDANNAPSDAVPAEPDSVTAVPLVTMLPDQEDVPIEWMQTEEGGRTAEEITQTFPDPVDAAQRFAEWAWSGNAFRTFTAPDGTASVSVSLHRFGTPEAADEALSYYMDGRIAAMGLQPRRIDQIGDQAAAITGSVADGTEATIYTRRGTVLARVTAVSAVDDPFAIAESTAKLVVGEIESDQ